MSPVTLATAWSMNFDYVASTMIGARTADQLEESLAALEVSLSDELMQRCDEVHKQHPYPMG
jgi:aryl-alcohol dehydrogenase-like predicted oxidoreductase